ncbi:MAG: SulP family inorganic anion transporter, partial [Flavobacteriales bacterium]|nr:SulP family inorganic anion transporter [Flavobacteriales bacterium]
MATSATGPAPSSLDALPVGWWRFVPALDSLRKYTRKAARADLLAGLSVATVAVPQAMAYALVAGVPPEYGLYTAIVMTAIGAFFASSRQLINGPTNAISIAVLSALAPIALADDKIAAVILLALMIGCIQLCIALFRLGDLTRYISHSVIVGFTAGASVLLVLDQMKNLLGKKAVGDVHEHFLMRFWNSMTAGGDIHSGTLLVGAASMALVLGLRWAKKRLGWHLFPELLVTVLVVSAAAHWLTIDGLSVVGTIPAKLPTFSVPNADYTM